MEHPSFWLIPITLVLLVWTILLFVWIVCLKFQHKTISKRIMLTLVVSIVIFLTGFFLVRRYLAPGLFGGFPRIEDLEEDKIKIKGIDY